MAQPLTKAERYVLGYLRTHGPTTHATLAKGLARSITGGSPRLGSIMVFFRDVGWVRAEIKKRGGMPAEFPVPETVTYLLTEYGNEVAAAAENDGPFPARPSASAPAPSPPASES